MAEKRRKVRPNDPHARLFREAQLDQDRAVAYRTLEATNPAIASGLEYPQYSVRYHAKLLELGPRFIESINHGGRVLELGAGTGRLAAHLLKLAPGTDYTIFDSKYSNPRFPLNRTLKMLAARGKIGLAHGDFHTHNFGTQTWKHILLPASFWGLDTSEMFYDIEMDRVKLVKKLLQHLEIGGTIRASHVSSKPMGLKRFLQWQANEGNIAFKITEGQLPSHVAKWTRDKKVHGLIITRLK